MSVRSRAFSSLVLGLCATANAYAADSLGEPGRSAGGPNALKNVYFGEEHLHTSNSPDAFVVGTRDGFGVLRDPIACKPAVLAETDQYVAFGSEYRALVNLPGIEDAKVWEPEPATVYFWSH